MLAPALVSLLTIIDNDCSGLIPPCWQELHYLFAGVSIGLIIAFPIYEFLHYRFTHRHD
jgi:hypothetical protein